MKGQVYLLVSMLMLSALCFAGCKGETDVAANMANPASVYCEENGGTLDIRTDSEGGQFGVCVFADGSECDEWDFFRDECIPGTLDDGGGFEEASDPVVGLANPASLYCEEQGGTLDFRTDSEGGQYGICVFEEGSECEEWAFLHGECSPAGTDQTIADWVGVIKSTPAGAQFDDYFQLVDDTGRDRNPYGIWAEGTLGAQLEELRDTGTIIKIWGTVSYNVPDYNNAQIKVTKLEAQ